MGGSRAMPEREEEADNEPSELAEFRVTSTLGDGGSASGQSRSLPVDGGTGPHPLQRRSDLGDP